MTDAGEEQFTVLVAGGGVAGLEAILALRQIEAADLSIELLSPDRDFRLAPLSVLEPFGADEPPALSIPEFCAEHDVELIEDGLAEVWPEPRRAMSESGTELPYDALLLCMGARRRPVLPGALNFRGSADTEAVEQLVAGVREQEGESSIAFVVPDAIEWSLPLYELAMLLADRLDRESATIRLITHESDPLEAFGPWASRQVRLLLEDAGVELETERRVSAESDGHIGADWVVSVPRLEVPEIPGLPQVAHGFVPVDPQMAVIGAERVWAAGDLTWSPLKQGGLAAQQADVAAAAIALASGAPVEVPPYAPVLRAALMTAEGPYYMRSGQGDETGGQRAPLWWPPAKVAGRLLAPYLASKHVDVAARGEELADLDADSARDADHRESLELALRWADLDASQGELRRALHWLEIAEGLNIAVPAAYREKRRDWREQLAG